MFLFDVAVLSGAALVMVGAVLAFMTAPGRRSNLKAKLDATRIHKSRQLPH